MFSDISLKAFQEIYDQLGIRFDHTLGESFYNDKVEPVYAELAAGRVWRSKARARWSSFIRSTRDSRPSP